MTISDPSPPARHRRCHSRRGREKRRRPHQPLRPHDRRWIARSRQRRALRDIAEIDYLLKDIGVSREEAFREAGKPFWRP